ncbi:hypothetical protein [Limnochorda pilosa]|uniref:Uncharacterized protein n=1 Tax=Limnochorda pilosa TaxID=1555112 RepID=A0A0K2SHB3_LIMPI|nr:hypothetical protein [Limnochorda pilosa]BAS26427.1 hypothetical protein LIP_0570 [Limnochorda pilosa]
MRARTRRTRLLSGILLLVLLGCTFRSAAAQVSLSGSLAHHFDVAPGESYEGVLGLKNRGSEPAVVRIYQTDYRFDAEGRTYYDEPGTLPRSNARWITVSRSLVTVPAGEESTVLYRISVPTDDRLTGTYWSMIMVEPLLPGDPEAPAPPGRAPAEEVALGIRQRFRYGVQVVTEAGGGAKVRLDFADPTLVYREDDRGYTFQVDLANPGERLLIPQVWMELYDARGDRIERLEVEPRRIYPDTSVRVRIDLGPLAHGSYQALVVADNKDASVFAARYTLELRAP